MYHPPTNFDARVLTKVEEHRRSDLVQILTQITEPWISLFHRSVGKEMRRLEYPMGDLVSVGLSGEPVAILVAMLRGHEVRLPHMQYSYYQCLLDGWRHWSIDTAAIAAVAIAYDPVIPNSLIRDFSVTIIDPLQRCEDVQEIRWPTQF